MEYKSCKKLTGKILNDAIKIRYFGTLTTDYIKGYDIWWTRKDISITESKVLREYQLTHGQMVAELTDSLKDKTSYFIWK